MDLDYQFNMNTADQTVPLHPSLILSNMTPRSPSLFDDEDDPPRGNCLESTESDEDEICYLSLFLKGCSFGGAVYGAESGILSVLPDQSSFEASRSSSSPDFRIVRNFINQTNPVHLIVSLNSSKSAMEMFKSLESDGDRMKLHFLLGREFAYNSGRQRLLNLRLPGFENETEENNFIFINSLLDLNCECMVRATGALLRFLEKGKVNLGGELVMGIKSLSLEDIVFLNETTFSALQIFNPSWEPSATKAGRWNRTREGLSLFGILNRCKSVLGVRALKRVFRSPPRNINSIERRQEAVAFFMNSSQSEFVKSLQEPIKSVKNVSVIMKKLRNNRASVRDWRCLKKTLEAVLVIGHLCRRKDKDEIEILTKISKNSDSEDLHAVAYFIEKVFDSTESQTQSRFVVKVGVDDNLDEKRRKHNGLPDLLFRVAQEEVNDLPTFMTSCAMVYMPHLGYLLTVPPWRNDLDENDYKSIPGMDFIFEANDVIHFKTQRCREMDTELGDIASEISDIETQIITRLSLFIVSSISETLVTLTYLVGELDGLISLSFVATEGGWTKPDLVHSGVPIQIKDGRHPLQELCVDTFVPNSTNFLEYRMSVLTGPNACGKSIYLKQVGLIVYLAHLGSWVPAASAVIPIVDRIDTRIQTLESISTGLSTFVVDLQQISTAVRSCSRNSLVLIDEFGKGTAEVDGEALLIACLNYFLDLKDECPFVIASTHFQNLKPHLTKTPLMKFETFQVVVEKDQLVYLYKLIEGISQYSYANVVAHNAGISESIIRRAVEIADCIRDEKPIRARVKISKEARLLAEVFINLDLDNESEFQKFREDVLKLNV